MIIYISISQMKYYKETIIALFTLFILYSGPNMLSNIINTPLGKIVAIGMLIVLANTYGKKYAIFYALIIIMLLQNVFEGMENKEGDTTQHGDNESNDENADDVSEDKEEATTAEPEGAEEDITDVNNIDGGEEELVTSENTSGKDQIDNEDRLKNVVPSDAPQNEKDEDTNNVEGFSNFNGGSLFAGY